MPHLFRSTILSISTALLRRNFSSKPKLATLSNVCSRNGREAIEQATRALVEYLHSTRSLPFIYVDMGIAKGEARELMGKCKSIFTDYPEDVLVKKVGFFCRLDVLKPGVGLLLLERPQLLSIDLETPTVSVLKILKHFGGEEELLKSVEQKYPYALGRNSMAHLPHVLRAMDVHEWFFNKIKHDHHLLSNCTLSCFDDGIDAKYVELLEEIRCSNTHVYKMQKLNFSHSIGFAENRYIVKMYSYVHGSSNELQERFDCLLAAGIEFSKVSKMLSRSPKIINQDAGFIKEKLDYLCQEIGSPLDMVEK